MTDYTKPDWEIRLEENARGRLVVLLNALGAVVVLWVYMKWWL